MTASASERWTARILGGLGARPVGHADPDDDGPQVPVTPPAPTVPAPAAATTATVPQRAGQTIRPWWDTRPRPAVGPDTWATPDDDADDQDTDEDEDDEVDEEKPAAYGPAVGGRVEKVATDSRGRPTRKRTGVRKHAEVVASDGRMRILAFNGTAAAVGYSFGLVDIFRVYLPVAEDAAVGVFGLVLAAGGAWVAWKASGFSAVRAVFGDKTPLVRVVLTAGAAGIGHELGPVPVAYLNAYGEEWDLGPETVSLLITAGGICGSLWWCIDRRLRGAHWTVRWFFRVPLASALLACLPYSGSPVA